MTDEIDRPFCSAETSGTELDRRRILDEARANVERLQGLENVMHLDAYREDVQQRWDRLQQQSAEPEKPAARLPDACLRRMIEDVREGLDRHREFVGDLLIELIASLEHDFKAEIAKIRDELAAACAELAVVRSVRSGEVAALRKGEVA